MTDLIRPWHEADRPFLRPLVLDLLHEQEAGGSLVVPCAENAELAIDEGIRAAAAGDPCMIAFDDSVAPGAVGCCIWMGKPTGFAMRARVCSALGMYVRPECRRQGWSQRIYEAAFARAREAGYEAAEGLAVRLGGLNAAVATGASPVGVVLRRAL